MAGVEKTMDSLKGRGKMLLKKPWKAMDLNQGIKHGAEDFGMAFTPEIPVPEEETIIPIPDAATASLDAKRRRAKSTRTGRESTILTEGLGG